MRNIQGGEFKSNDEILRSVYLHLTYRIKHGIGEKNLQIIYVIRNFLLKFFKEHSRKTHTKAKDLNIYQK